MTEDRNSDGRSDQSTEQYSQANREQRDATAASNEPIPYTREEWEAVPSDPDLVRNLGYALTDWEEFETHDGSGQVMFLPGEEEQIRNDAFVVADSEAVLDLASKR